ncbi:MAG TPA: hypothetical protein VF844_14950 [Ktedonobacteraceae bacterium]
MNQETNSGTQDAQQEKATNYKRSRSGGRNRPVLVSPSSDDKVTEELSQTTQQVEEGASTTTVEDTRPRRLPRFFSSVGKHEKEGAVEANPAAARIARATRSTGASSASNRTVKESKPAESKSNATKVSTKAAPARPTRQGGFKTRYVWGMAIYVLVAMVVGQYERALLVANHLENILFKIGSFAVSTSTALYLLTLIILLVILARFDLIPRSLGAMSGQPATQRGKPGQSSSGSDDTKSPSPTMKQGVKGADDDLYQEYREQQRYLQRRERKK